MERNPQNALNVARNLYHESSLVPSGGTTKTKMAQRKKTAMLTSDSNKVYKKGINATNKAMYLATEFCAPEHITIYTLEDATMYGAQDDAINRSTDLTAHNLCALEYAALNIKKRAYTTKTWETPEGKLIKPCESVLPLGSKFWSWSKFRSLV